MRPFGVVLALALLLAPAVEGPVAAQSGSGRLSLEYAGLPLTEALDDLRERGLRLVYGSNVVGPWMTVGSDLEAASLREGLDALLAPHDLVTRDAKGGIVTIR